MDKEENKKKQQIVYNYREQAKRYLGHRCDWPG